jgi:acyl transferase domain-containing protein
MTSQLTQHIVEHPEHNLADVAATLMMGRRTFAFRRFLVAQDTQQIQHALHGGPEHWVDGEQQQQNRAVVFLIPGQGNLMVGAGSGLYQSEPVFRQTFDACADILRPHLEVDIRTLLYPSPGQEVQAQAALQETAYAQPIQFSLSYALAKLWRSWGIQPQAMLGHSLGEYVAACLAGVLSYEDALPLVAYRGALMQAMPTGAMLSVPLSAEDTRTRLVPGLEIAALNGAKLTVVAGPGELLAAWQQQLDADGINCRSLRVTRAFHSALLEPMISPFVEALGKIPLRKPQIPYVSNLSGTWITERQATDPAYWGSQLRQPVQFMQGLCTLQEYAPGALLEVGPGTSLSSLARHYQRTTPSNHQGAVVASMPHPKDTRHERAVLLEAAGQLWLAGVSPDWEALADTPWQRLRLPTYPFERDSFWYGSKTLSEASLPSIPQLATQPTHVASHLFSEEAMDAPGSQTLAIEQLVIAAWCDKIGVSHIERDDDFFALGGDSLVASLVTAHFTETFGIEIPLRLTFEYPTVSALALAIEELLIAHLEALPDSPDS